MAEINSYILEYRPMSYADTTENERCRLDCTLGVNPEAIPQIVMDALGTVSADEIKHYPHDIEVVGRIAEHYSEIASLSDENIAIGSGSFDLLCNINMLYLNCQKSLMGYAPQFSAYIDHVRCMGAQYIPCLLKKDAAYQFVLDDFLRHMEENTAQLVCIENPNNPTGQILPLAVIEKIVVEAEKRGAAVVVDEAYGEYMELSNSAIGLVGKYEHLFVTRTFSKGYGMAGIRMGYAIGAKRPMEQLKKLVTPFNCSNMSRRMAIAMLELPEFCLEMRQNVQEKKQRVMASLKKIRVAQTSMTTPIMLLYVEDENFDLCRHLYQSGIAAVSGMAYDNLGANSVRMMICEDTALLIQLLGEAEEKL